MTLEAGVVVKFKNNASLTVHAGGNLVTRGTKNSPVILTSYHDDAADDRDTDLATIDPTLDEWDGLVLEDGAGAILNGMTMRYSDGLNIGAHDVAWRDGEYTFSGQVTISGRRTLFEDLLFEDNHGIIHITQAGSIDMRNSIVRDVETGVVFQMYEQVETSGSAVVPASVQSSFRGNSFEATGTPLSVEYDHTDTDEVVLENGPVFRQNNLRSSTSGGVEVHGSPFLEPTWSHNYWGAAPAGFNCTDGTQTVPSDVPTIGNSSDITIPHNARSTFGFDHCKFGWPVGGHVDGIVTHPALHAPITTGLMDQYGLGFGSLFGPKTHLDATDPVNTFIGNFYHSRADLEILVPGVNPTIGRTYNSLDTDPGVFGDGWSSLLDVGLHVAGDRATFRTETGQRVEFAKSIDGPWYQMFGSWTTLVGDAEHGYTMTLRTGTTYRFDELGRLTQSLDRHGNGFRIGRLADDLTVFCAVVCRPDRDVHDPDPTQARCSLDDAQGGARCQRLTCRHPGSRRLIWLACSRFVIGVRRLRSHVVSAG